MEEDWFWLLGLFFPRDVNLTNTDNDTWGFTVTPTAGLVTTELGGMDTFSIALNSEPLNNVTIALNSSDLAEGTIDKLLLTFTNLDWNIPQVVTLTGVDDLVVDGNIVYTIVTGASASADPLYSGKAVSDVSATNNDND